MGCYQSRARYLMPLVDSIFNEIEKIKLKARRSSKSHIAILKAFSASAFLALFVFTFVLLFLLMLTFFLLFLFRFH